MTAATDTSHWAALGLAGRFRTRSARSRALFPRMLPSTHPYLRLVKNWCIISLETRFIYFLDYSWNLLRR